MGTVVLKQPRLIQPNKALATPIAILKKPRFRHRGATRAYARNFPDSSRRSSALRSLADRLRYVSNLI